MYKKAEEGKEKLVSLTNQIVVFFGKQYIHLIKHKHHNEVLYVNVKSVRKKSKINSVQNCLTVAGIVKF